MKKIPVLVYTDIGDDIDDSLATAYLVAHPNIDLVGIICDHNVIDYRMHTAQYLLDILKYPAPVQGEEHDIFLEELLKKYKRDLVILSIAPTTQLSKDIERFTQLFAGIKRIYFQGQVHDHDAKISPNMQSYNFAQDPEAIQHILKYDIPMTFV
ncbi:TPA: hypothetical protein DCZ39_05690 [Patescibacteria group bacterium]|nr:hypothetical protein [Candidatus Gracilibacteria bacterium]